MLTVGRLHPTKGAQRIVDAVVAEPGLADRVNIVIVGGELASPSADEQSTIELVRLAARGADPSLVTLTGNLPPSAVADLMVEVAEHGGVYVCAADKEEFGLAIVEAMAAGAVVVAPARGGPRSYVDHGRDGLLCDTLSPSAVRAAIVQARELASVRGRRTAGRAFGGGAPQGAARSEHRHDGVVVGCGLPRPVAGSDAVAACRLMRLLVVSPDYASHLLPMLQIAAAWQARAGDVVVATGPATRPMVVAAGLDWIELRLGRGSNAGVIEVGEQPRGEDDHLRAFFDATRAGPIETLRYQADARRHDLLYDPDGVFERLGEIVREVRPDRVAVDHVAFGRGSRCTCSTCRRRRWCWVIRARCRRPARCTASRRPGRRR